MTTLAKWSVEDYHRMIAAGILCDRHVELLAGDIIQISPERPLHASRIRKIANYLRIYQCLPCIVKDEFLECSVREFKNITTFHPQNFQI